MHSLTACRCDPFWHDGLRLKATVRWAEHRVDWTPSGASSCDRERQTLSRLAKDTPPLWSDCLQQLSPLPRLSQVKLSQLKTALPVPQTWGANPPLGPLGSAVYGDAIRSPQRDQWVVCAG